MCLYLLYVLLLIKCGGVMIMFLVSIVKPVQKAKTPQAASKVSDHTHQTHPLIIIISRLLQLIKQLLRLRLSVNKPHLLLIN